MVAQRAFEHRLFVQAGFSPIAQAGAGGSEIRRLLLFDPYMILPIPGVELQHSGRRPCDPAAPIS